MYPESFSLTLKQSSRDMDFEQRFAIHSAGQGFCYSGKVKYQESEEYRFVFDCGTNNKYSLRREIEQMRSDGLSARRRLDLLVISHFDADHVNMIEELLKGGIQIKKLIMPFLFFHERLFLVFKQFLGRKRIAESEIDAFRIMLDPIGTLGNNLDEEGGIFLLIGDELPIPGGGGQVSVDRDEEVRKAILEDDFSNFNEDISNGFSFSRMRRPDGIQMAQFFLQANDQRVRVVRDSSKASLSLGGDKLMEFLFYKKSIGPFEERFYRVLEDLFYKREHLSPSDPDFMNKLITILKKSYRSAAPVRSLFKEAAKIIGIPLGIATDLNTTALCMLHRNVADLPKKIIVGKPGYLNFKAETHGFYHFKDHVQTFPVRPIYHSGYGSFPNVLLTSDTFLKSSYDLQAFLAKYQYYLNDFWLAQIPHHGSARNCDHTFFDKLHDDCAFFVNYGLNNRHGHPALAVMQLANKKAWPGPYLINDYQGLQIVYGINHNPLPA
jgi:hypothetical protein